MSNLMVLAVMVALSVLGMLCTRALLAQRHNSQQSIADAQLELMVVTADQWMRNGGNLPEDGTTSLRLISADESLVCGIELSRMPNVVIGIATIERNGKLVGTRKFEMRN